ncbi:GDP-mannose 4,6-dehydratase [Sporosarcina aquimarina]|uniref:GDP-mannose 4,6-dehydratase n=1 Tax=Sporosarcina aquimarina TaxID=114975 RepID=A0ABU4G2W0_9BACL|nr:GDP-mannose 4,6-dehydratase [Sporosarcina aquimarina]MDW0110680.1 GDP-mannose 4,6-dehydratase [Sporosarcina aquimarina]
MESQSLSKNDVILITGAAGFIGSHLSAHLMDLGCSVIGVDNLNAYYDRTLKHSRLERLKANDLFTFYKVDISDASLMEVIFAKEKPTVVIHLAAQAGVRYSIENPDAYIQSNLIGFYNMLECCRNHPVKHFLYASSSSVYGANQKVPFEESDTADHPVSLYAATKKSNELMSYTYSHLYNIPSTGLRFFTVYGPWGRPDMAYFSFTNQYFAGEAIAIYNDGNLEEDLYRDFTYVDDVVSGIEKLIACPPVAANGAPHVIYNIGNDHPEKLMHFIETLETALSNATGKPVLFNKNFEPIKPGDVRKTYASTLKLQELIGFKPATSIEDGLRKFADWYVGYYGN